MAKSFRGKKPHITSGPFPSWLLTRLLVVSVALFLSSCTCDKGPLGSATNPIKIYFVPSVDIKVLEDNSKAIKEYLEANTPYHFTVSIPTSFVAVVEAFGTHRADVSAMNTFGYLMAHERYRATARLTVLRHGSSTYQAQFVARAGGPIQKLEDLAGKRVAFVDPASTSGYLLPLKVLRERSIQPSETMFAMRHDSVISMIYQGQVDAGATFYSPPTEGEIQDARRLVKTQYPDVEEKIAIIELTDSIPNDPIVFRAGLDEEIVNTIVDTFLKYIETPEGRQAFNSIYGVTALQRAQDSDYDGVRQMLETLGVSAGQLAGRR